MDDEDQVVSPVSGRGQHFGAGMVGGQVMPSESLLQLAARYKAQTPTSYRSTGSASGMSTDQYQATLGGMFPTQNGMATDTYSTKKYYSGSNS